MSIWKQPKLVSSLAVAALVGAASGTALAEPMQIDAILSPKADAKLDFADGSKRFLIAAQREGKASGSGPLAGATVQEWGFHDVNPAEGANANGYLIFRAAGGDLAYLRYSFRGTPIPGPDGKPRFVGNGFWESAGGTGSLKALRGAGTVKIDPRERRWTLIGELVSTH